MPERTINSLTGGVPDLVFPIPLELWDDYGLEGNEIILCKIVRVINHWGEVVRNVGRRVECKTEFYNSLLGWTGTGIIIPEYIVEEFRIKPEHYLEVLLISVKKDGVETPIYPGETVEREMRKNILDGGPPRE